MTEPKPTYSANGEKSEDRDRITAELLTFRQHAIGLAVSSERLLEMLDYAVESAIVTRHERRILTRRIRKRNM